MYRYAPVVTMVVVFSNSSIGLSSRCAFCFPFCLSRRTPWMTRNSETINRNQETSWYQAKGLANQWSRFSTVSPRIVSQAKKR